MVQKDYYKILGISKEATNDEIKKAFRQLARKYHPDVNPLNKESEEKFKEVNEAFQVLGNPTKKQQYDQYGSSPFSQDDLRGNRGQNYNFEEDPFDFGFGDLFEIFNNRRSGRSNSKEGADLRYDIEITLEEAFFGVKKLIEVPIHNICKKCKGLGASEKNFSICDKCNGLGQVKNIQRRGFTQYVSVGPCDKCDGKGKIITKPCEACNGNGDIEKIEKIEIKIPKGVNHGQYLRIEGKGERGINAPSGDLYIVIHVKKHELFKREDENLFLDTNIDLISAIFGGEIEIIGIDEKKLKIKIPAGTQSYTPLRLEGQGMHFIDSKKRGDLFLRLIVNIPKLSSDKEKNFRNFFE